MNKLTNKEKLLTLAYAGIPTIGNFAKNYQGLSEELKMRATCVYACAYLINVMKKSNTLPISQINKYFGAKEVREFFDSLISSNQDDPRDIKLITRFVEGLYEFTDSGMETYADFNPFLLFEHEAWLRLVIHIQHIQNSDSVVLELKRMVEIFVAKGFSLILHPSLNEYSDSVKFFSWFEKLKFNEKKKLVAKAMQIWNARESIGSYELSGERGEEWYKAALVFSIHITSKEYVSKVFAESFKNSCPEIYEKFRLLAGLNEFEVAPYVMSEKRMEKEEIAMQKLFGQYTHELDVLVDILIKDKRVKKLADIIFAIFVDFSDDRHEHVKRTLGLLIGKYKGCALVQELSLMFTKNLEKKLEEDSLAYEDLPPSASYITNQDLYWLF